MNQELVERFEKLLLETKRPGIENLLEFIRKSDFYTAPASTRFHGAYEGGLLEHSINVLECLAEKKASYNAIWHKILVNVQSESIVISSLLHDLCKTYFYTTEMRNKKDESGAWVSVPFYTVNDLIPYGHGEKSVMMIEEYIKLLPAERYAIRWHMGSYEPKELWNTLGTAMEKYPLVLALHEADMEATYLLEKEK
ncbi:HD domain-containing protein [Lacrimispora indolis]|uniref:HD domain-containing protein n=1 Tax=Lacrimispora indolis TaxID=69825 RepID=UPI00045E7B5A|nr:HD domain-containing protein [Lacrimispora indolis]